MIPELKQRITVIERGTILLVGLSTGLLLLKIVQIFVYFDASTGHLRDTFLRSLLDGVFTVGIVALLALGVLLGWIVLAAGTLSCKPGFAGGITLAVAAACFLVQGISDMADGLQRPDAYLADLGRTRTLTWMDRMDWPRVWLVVLAILCALTLALAARAILDHRRPNTFFFLPLVLWSGLLLADLLMSYPQTISMQSAASETVCSVLGLLFTLDLAEQFSDDGAPDTISRYTVRLVAPVVLLVIALPYVVSWLFGVQDEVPRVPYLALCGLSVYGATSLWEILTNASHYFRQMNRRSNYRSR